jgi:hypothetical protein
VQFDVTFFDALAEICVRAAIRDSTTTLWQISRMARQLLAYQ